MPDNTIGPRIPDTTYKPVEIGQTAQTSNVTITPNAVTWTDKQGIYAYDKQSKLFTFKSNKESDSKCMDSEQLGIFLDKVDKDPKGNKILGEMGQNLYYPYNAPALPPMMSVPVKNPIISYSIKDKDNAYLVEENTNNSTRKIYTTFNGQKSYLYKTEKYEATKQGENTVYKWIESKNSEETKERLENFRENHFPSFPSSPPILIPPPASPTKPPLA